MYNLFVYIAVLIIFSTMQFACVKKVEEPDNLSMFPASCRECHSFPGSDNCRNDTLNINGNTVTTCALCHMGSVIPDSTEKVVEQIIQQDTVDTIITLYHDRMITYHGKAYPATGSHHGNDSVDFNPGQCYKCHGYPPMKGAHIHHVVEKKKECADCHLSAFQCSTYVLANQTFYTPKKQKGLGQASVPILDPKTHLNGFSGDITFKEKVQNADDPAYDTLFLWDPEKRTCSYSKCHNPVLLGLQHYKQEIWKEVK